MSVDQSQPQFDQEKAQAFAGKVLTVLNHGALCLMISVGHRTGLFDTMSQMPPAQSDEIASRGGLNERYVREWLGARCHVGRREDTGVPAERWVPVGQHAPIRS